MTWGSLSQHPFSPLGTLFFQTFQLSIDLSLSSLVFFYSSSRSFINSFSHFWFLITFSNFISFYFFAFLYFFCLFFSISFLLFFRGLFLSILFFFFSSIHSTNARTWLSTLTIVEIYFCFVQPLNHNS